MENQANPQTQTQAQDKKMPFSFGVLGIVIAVLLVGGYYLLGGGFAGGVGQTIEAGNPEESGAQVLSCEGSGAQGSYVQLGLVDESVDCATE